MKLLKLTFAGLLMVSAPWSAALAACEGLSDIVEAELGAGRAQKSGYGMAVVERSTGRVLCEDYHARNRNVYPASSIKTLVAIATLRQVDQGALRLDQMLTITQSNANAECRPWGCDSYGFGGQVSVRKLLRDMLTISNNIATNQLIEQASKTFINETADQMGAASLRVRRRVYQDVNPEPEITERNAASAGGMVQMYREVATGRLGVLRERSRRHLISLLGMREHNDRLSHDFPDGVKFYHKTGSTSDSTSDAGFFSLDENTVVVLVGLQDFRDKTTLQRIGRQAFDLAVTSRY